MSNYPPNYERWPNQPPPGNYDPQATYTPPPPKKRLRWLPWALAGALVLATIGCIAAMFAADPKGEPVAPKATTQTAQAQPGAAVGKESAKAAKSAAPKKAASLPTRVGDGTFIVGKDVAAGEYKTKGAEEGIITLCTWRTSKDNSFDKVIDFGAADDIAQPSLVTLKNGQYFKTNGCQPWVRQ